MPTYPDTETLIDALATGNLYWTGGNYTYSIPAAGSSWSGYAGGQEPSNGDYSVLSLAQAARFRAAMELWDSYIAPNFTEVTEPGGVGQIRIAFTDIDDFGFGGFWGYAYTPQQPPFSPTARQGDIWIDDSIAGAGFAVGDGDWSSMLHEIGHALGIKHPFEGGETLPPELENSRFTLMSYTDPADIVHRYFVDTGGGGISSHGVYLQMETPMVLDILAVQSLYGADYTTAAGDDVYTFDEDTPFFMSIWDGGGTDTIDLSAHARGSVISLTPGQYSSIAQFSEAEQVAWWQSQFDPFFNDFIADWLDSSDLYTWTDNLGIAFGAIIENVIGGADADFITGNSTSNLISGRGGDDVIDGGDGIDTADMSTETLSVFGHLGWGYAAGSAFLGGGANIGQDALYNIENLTGGSGNDVLIGNGGANAIDGGGGSDWVEGDTGADTVSGGAGVDAVFGGAGDDILSGGDGDDGVIGGADNDTLNGGAGIDWIYGEGGNDTAYGGTETDIIIGGAGADILNGDAGNDALIGEAGADTLDGGDGDDWIEGGADNDDLDGWLGHDTLIGGDGNDAIYGYDGNDGISGGAGNDELDGEDGNDYITGEDGDDSLTGGAGNDGLFGGEGVNTYSGGDGDDGLIGGSGAETMNGDAGSDYIQGWGGADTLTGGTGGDAFVYSTNTDSLVGSEDHITDFNFAEGDRIDLRQLDGNWITGGHQPFQIVGSFTGAAAQMTATYDAGGNITTLAMDFNGDAQADMVITATGNVTAAQNFLFV
jgi:serralysin